VLAIVTSLRATYQDDPSIHSLQSCKNCVRSGILYKWHYCWLPPDLSHINGPHLLHWLCMRSTPVLSLIEAIKNNYLFIYLLVSWTEHFVVSLWSNQQMSPGSSMIYLCIPNFTPACFNNSLSSSGGRIYLRSYPNNICVVDVYGLRFVANCRGMPRLPSTVGHIWDRHVPRL
jgi:hypothetical protein